MKNFWGYIKNDMFGVGCTGQTVYVYDDKGNELKKFKDIIYGYTPMFSPQKNMFVIKSTVGMLAIYSLESMQLIKKFRFSKVDGWQGNGFCFSKDGRYFYNIECHIDNLKTCLSIYETSDFKRVKQLFLDDFSQVLSHIEYDSNRNSFFVLGFMRDNTGMLAECFVAQLQDEILINKTIISYDEYDFIQGYKHLELLGFTSKAKEWSGLQYSGYDLSQIETKRIVLSDYIKES